MDRRTTVEVTFTQAKNAGLEHRHAKLADQLRGMRRARGIKSGDVARRCAWDAAKMSRIERGQQFPTENDINALLDALDISDEEASTTREQWQSLRMDVMQIIERLKHGIAPVQRDHLDDEDTATRISEFVPTLIPGLLQTAPYARGIFQLAYDFHGIVSDIDNAVRLRIARQQILYDGKPVDIVFDERVIWTPPPSVTRAEMAAQLEKIRDLSASLSATVRIAILPIGMIMPTLPLNGYTIRESDTGTRVELETVSSAMTIENPHETDLYRKHFDILRAHAVSENELHQLISRAIQYYTAEAHN
jgi:transcriptional regulator with XRE-family HTH domain